MVPFLNSTRRSKANHLRPRDFSIKSYGAPSTAHRLSQAYRQPAKARWRKYVWWSLLGALLLVVITSAYSPFFTIRNVIINHVPSRATEQRLQQIVGEVMKTRRAFILPQSNLIFFSTKLAQQAIAKEFYTEGLSFERHWPSVLKVNLAENLVVARWRVGDRVFALDKRGILVQELSPDSPPGELVEVRERLPEPPAQAPERKLGEQVASEEVVKFIDLLSATWRSQLPKLAIDYILFDSKDLPSFRVFTPVGWYVFVSAQAEVPPQVEALKRLLADKIKADESRLEYIDVRFISRLYVKMR